MVRHFHAQGVLLTAGSDLGGWMTPGVSLHRELELLVATGISPMDAIRIGTSNGARALGISDQVGTLEQGMLADILILRENPLVDIRNTLTIELVLQGGLILDPGKLLSGTQAPQ
jgi:imidazolonepropionase-like amidohydrolase